MSRFLCTGDLHLGAGSDYGREPGDRLKDQRTTLGIIVELARAHSVDAILFAGDLFDGPTATPEQYAAVQQPLRELEIPFIAITGNGKHDCAMRDVKAPEVLGDVAWIFTEPSIRVVGDTVIAMLPWTPVSRLVAALDGGDRDDVHRDAARLLIQAARDLHEQIAATTGPTVTRSVLMLHWSIEGASLPNGLQIDDHAREPILPIDELEALGFDAIVAGHIHRPQLLASTPFEEGVQPANPIFYTGSPMPLNFGEAHEHGVWILDVGEAVHLDFLPIDSRPFVTHDLDLTTHDGIFDLAALADVTDAVVRVRYRATEEQARRFDHSDWTRDLYAAGAHKVYAIQADVIREGRARVDGVDEEIAPLAAVLAWCDANEIPDHTPLEELTARYLQEVGS